MLASSSTPWYSSVTFWTGAQVLIAVLALIVSVIFWFYGSPRRLLIYGLPSETALFNRDAHSWPGVGTELQVTLDGQALTDPHIVSVAIVSRSRRDIRSTDFEEGKPLKLDVGTPILKLLDTDTGGTAMPEIKLGIDGTALTIAPGLINRRQAIVVDILTDEPVSLSCSNPPLADVTVRDGTQDDVAPLWSTRVFGIAWMLILAGFVLYAIPATRSNAKPFNLLDAGFSTFFIAMIIIFTTGAIREGGLSLDPPANCGGSFPA